MAVQSTKVEDLVAATARAERALGDADAAALQLALAELRELATASSDKLLATSNAWNVVHALEAELAARRMQALVSRLGLRPCGCGSVDLFVSGETHVERLLVDGASVDLRLRIVACPACGEVRFKAQDPEILPQLRTTADRLAFTSVNIDTRQGPFR